MHYAQEHADIIITVQDNWVMPAKLYKDLNWYPWFPVDDDPPSWELMNTLEDRAGNSLPKKALVYSKWGVDQLKKEGYDNTLYLPESVDTSIYKDLGMKSSKKRLGYKEKDFIVGMIAANHGYPSRKAFDKNLIGFAKFASKHKNAKLYLHTNYDGSWQLHDSYDLLGLLKLLSRDYPVLLEPGRVNFPEQYRLFMGIPDEAMALRYSTFNVLLAATGAEGFGLPIIEAQACGVPVIVTDFSSMPELVGAGWKVPVKDRFLTGRISYQVWPNEDGIAEALENAYQADPNEMSKKAREFALQFDNKTVAEKHWKPFLESVKK